jgi:poly(hydroxyalkanoate) depolymerase family esterase
MRSLSDTIARLKHLQGSSPGTAPATARLRPFAGSGLNPGQLNGWIYVPESMAPGAPLVVVLHGCTQSAAGYDENSGWSRLADQHGFVLLYPEQQRANNPNLCFNWFSPDDAARNRGEALSIAEMVDSVHARLGTDRQRVFVTGLSAGGAMAAVMLATYPDIFASGAVIAGLPFGIARSIPEAFDRMRGHDGRHPAELSQLVRDASDHSARWPTLSVWHGSADATVDPSNASVLVEQWRSLHGAATAPSETNLVHGFPHQVWRDSTGRAVVEAYSISGLGHGTPLDTSGTRHGEKAGPFMLEAGISSTYLISCFWDIVPEQTADPRFILPAATPEPTEPQPRPTRAESWSGQGGIEASIERALRGAGLMR